MNVSDRCLRKRVLIMNGWVARGLDQTKSLLACGAGERHGELEQRYLVFAESNVLTKI